MATSPPFLSLLQQLGRGGPPGAAGPGAPPPGLGGPSPHPGLPPMLQGGLAGARKASLTPPGFEAQDFAELLSRIDAIAQAYLPRDRAVAEAFLKAAQSFSKAAELAKELPAHNAPVAPPPPGFPQGGMGMLGTPPMGEMPMGMMG